MTPRRRRRLAVTLCVLCGAAVAAALSAAAFRENLLFFYTPSQLHAEMPDSSRPFRLGGLVETGTVQREPGDLQVRFVVRDESRRVTVTYRGVLPDLFGEGRGVVARGVWDGAIFAADEVLAKHDENYAPPGTEDAVRAGQIVGTR